VSTDYAVVDVRIMICMSTV